MQTLTSLGYGDFSPTTLLGKLVGSACAVSGVLVMALPIPIVVDNFGNYYAEQKKLEQREMKVEAAERAARMVRRQQVVAREGVVDTVITQRGHMVSRADSAGSLEQEVGGVMVSTGQNSVTLQEESTRTETYS